MAGSVTNRLRTVVPALLVAVNFWTAAGVPILHAETEVLSTQAAFESGHSDRCAVLHLESRCTVSTMHLVVVASARDLALVRQLVIAATATDTGAVLLPTPNSSANAVRAPPTA